MSRQDVGTPPIVLRRAPRAAFALALALVLAACAREAAAGVNLQRLEFLQESVKLSGQSFVSGMGFRAHLAGGDLNEPLEIVPALEYWKDTDRIPELGVIEVMQRDWRIGADLRYKFGSGSSWRPYGGAGLALHIHKSSSTIQPVGSPAYSASESGNSIAPNFLVGLDFPAAGPIRNAIELNWHLVPDLKQFKINFGIGWEFGGGEGADENKVY